MKWEGGGWMVRKMDWTTEQKNEIQKKGERKSKEKGWNRRG